MFLDFDLPLEELENKISALKKAANTHNIDVKKDILSLEERFQKQAKKIYGKLTPWQKVMVARHENRPQGSDYIKALFEDVVMLGGDRTVAEDKAILGGLGRLKPLDDGAAFQEKPFPIPNQKTEGGMNERRGPSVVFLCHEKGRNPESRRRHNFGMAHPEGYRKAIRLMKMAEKFGLPVLCFVDTPGAYPGSKAEERGQSVAIGECIKTSLNLKVPIISVIIGEGGSGGAVALATANRVLMLDNAVYSVISPEGGASILYRTKDKKADMAAAQKLTSRDLKKFGIVDDVIPEPIGGAHRRPFEAMNQVKKALYHQLESLSQEGEKGQKTDERSHGNGGGNWEKTKGYRANYISESVNYGLMRREKFLAMTRLERLESLGVVEKSKALRHNNSLALTGHGSHDIAAEAEARKTVKSRVKKVVKGAVKKVGSQVRSAGTMGKKSLKKRRATKAMIEAAKALRDAKRAERRKVLAESFSGPKTEEGVRKL